MTMPCRISARNAAGRAGKASWLRRCCQDISSDLPGVVSQPTEVFCCFWQIQYSARGCRYFLAEQGKVFQQARNHLRVVEPGREGGPQWCQRVCYWLQFGMRMHTDRFYPERATCFDRSVATFSSQTVGVTKQGAVQIGETRDNQPGQYRPAVGTFDG